MNSLNLAKFKPKNYFLKLEFENKQMTTLLANSLKVPKEMDLAQLLGSITDDLMVSRKFTDKCILILAFIKKLLLE